MTKRTLYCFDGFELDADQMRLFREGEAVAAEPQVIMLLTLLVKRHGEIVTKSEINEAVWDGRVVSPSALASRLRAARAVIDDDGSSQRLIRTIPNVGLRFVGEVRTVEARASRLPFLPPWLLHRPRLAAAGIAAVVMVTGGSVYAWHMPSQALRSNFVVTHGAAIYGHNTRPLSYLSLKECMQACLDETDFVCKSFDFSAERKSCDLSNVTAEEAGGLKEDYYRDPYDHYARNDIEAPEVKSANRP